MKKTIVFISTILLFGCYSGKQGPLSKKDKFLYSYIYAIDSTSSMSEDPATPGTFNKVYDTVLVRVKYRNKIRHGYIVDSGHMTYKIVKTKIK